MTAPCFKCGAARSCKHREVDEPREPEPGMRGDISPRHVGSVEDRRKYTRTLTGSPVHRERLLKGVQRRLNG